MVFFMTTKFLDSQESDVSLPAATVGIKSYQRGKKQVISIGHIHIWVVFRKFQTIFGQVCKKPHFQYS